MTEETKQVSESPSIRARDLRKRYGEGDGVRAALDGVSLDVSRGEFVAVLGPSGCGKSTLLGILGCLDRSFEGELRLFGRDVRALGDRERARLRGTRIGFVFQAFHLLGHLSARDNVLAPTLFAAEADRERIFEPFVSLSQSPEGESTGMGLATVRRVVNSVRGEVWCQAAPGRGARFVVSVPVAGLVIATSSRAQSAPSQS